jgi:alcohol dehydrogenase
MRFAIRSGSAREIQRFPILADQAKSMVSGTADPLLRDGGGHSKEIEMKAIVFHRHGDIDQLRYEDFPDPSLGPEDVLVRVRAVSLNGFDPMILKGIPGLKTPLPMIPGADFAGEVLEVGPAVDRARWWKGQRVTNVPLRPGAGMMGETLRGAAAECCVLPQSSLLPLPDAVSFVDAACLPTAYGTALRMMQTRGKVAHGERVLVLGASGGVGTCCVQLAKLAGAEVVACASSDEKVKKLRELGADHGVNTTTQSYVDEVVRLYGKPKVWGASGGVDVIVNYTGGSTWAQCFRALKRDGRLLTCGATAGYAPATDIRYIWSFEFRIIGSNGWTPEDQLELLNMVADRRIKPVVHSIRPLRELPAALQELMDRKVFGKVVLEP